MSQKKYGVFVGRFQPFHKGHQSSIQHIINQGFIPVIIVGSAQANGTEKNPYSYSDRVLMIREIYPDVIILPLEDSLEDDKSWVSRLENLVQSTVGSDYVYFVHNKESEKGKYQSTSKDEFISDKIQHQKIDISHLMDVKISSTDIRNNLELNKEFLDTKIYNILKDKNVYKK